MNKWNPSEEQKSGSISRTFDFLIDELTELQDELNCPDEFILDLVEAIRDRWSPESCHSRMRELKKENPDAF